MKAACHCGAVRYETTAPPAWVLDCNCTLCRRYGALWAYVRGREPVTLTLEPDPDATDTYMWGDNELAFHRCKVCGCMTHMRAVEADAIHGVNTRMMVGLDPAKVRVVQIDNGHSGFFWTRAAEAPLASNHPPMPRPGPDDWR
ncbi:MAG TPA: hypothetical protein VKU90_10835 [Caulobacteraceae bacterium]|nr:hypothetical protein [Caulobacteraceae bacterium]